MNFDFERFLTTLPIIGYSLVGIFATIGVLIAIVYVLNKASDALANRGNKNEENTEN